MASQCSAIEVPVTVKLKGVTAGPGFTQELRDTAEAMWRLADRLEGPVEPPHDDRRPCPHCDGTGKAPE